MPDLDPTAAPEATATDPAAEHASAFLERAAVRAGISAETEPPEAPEGAATGETARRETAQPERQHAPDRSRAQEQWAERNARRQAEAESRARDRVLAELSDKLAKMELPTQAAPPSPGEADPEPDMHEDYGAWMAWRDRQLEQRLTEKITGKLDPILQHLDGQRQRDQQAWEARERDQQTRGWLSEQERTAREAHEIYISTPEGEGFSDRLTLMFGHPGRAGDPARGVEAVEPFDGAMTLGLIRGGVDVKTARLLTLANYRALHEFALSRQLNPAVLVDALMRTEMEAASQYYGPQGQPRRTAPAEPTSEARRMRATAKGAAGVTGSAVDAPAPTGQRDLRQILASGEITPDKVREVAKARGITVAQAAQQLRRVADEMRRAG